ncbi:hypothetical protein [Faecalibacterium sp. An122]|uniref:hypothetical protein n=1 Tax=Faecalibacterium sp. An122 TaxID=1965551 RepID=UPI00117B92D7|nr:hypothetical protein [Faecalibacterium sp. An122]
MKSMKFAARFISIVFAVMVIFAGCSSEAGSGSRMVWIPTNGGTKYHKDSDCSSMINPEHVTLEYAEAQGYTPCQRCY